MFYIEKFNINDKEYIYPLISIACSDSILYVVAILDVADDRKYEYGDEIYSSNDLYSAIHFANNILTECGYVQLDSKLEILL